MLTTVDFYPWLRELRRRGQQRASERRIRKARRKAKRCPKCGARPRLKRIHCGPCLDYAAGLMASRRRDGKA